MRRIASTLVVIVLALLAPRGAQALEIAKRFGLGYQGTLAGAHGLSGRYQASDSIGLELIAGFGTIRADDDALGNFDTLYFAGGFSFVLANDDRGFVSLGTRFNVGTSTFSKFESKERVTDIAFEVPLSIEYFVTPHFSLRVGVGLVFAILREVPPSDVDGHHPPSDPHVLEQDESLATPECGARSRCVEDAAGGSSLSLGTGELLANGGFTLWF